jgi:ferredoxin
MLMRSRSPTGRDGASSTQTESPSTSAKDNEQNRITRQTSKRIWVKNTNIPSFLSLFRSSSVIFLYLLGKLNQHKRYFMAITKVWLDESSDECVSCGACEATCDAVFTVPEKMVVKEGVDFSAYENEIKDAAESCPAGVIKFS